MDNVISLICLAKKAGRLEIGEEPVGAACRSREAKVVLLASDAAANTARRAAHFGEAGKVLWLPVPLTKTELGQAVGRASCAMMAVTDVGLAAALVKKLAASDPGTYGPAAERLSGKAAKALQRQREQQTHKKNIQHGEERSRAPHPDKK
jgi:ribosomal protein L7Ae-like RNA K-turn-binding protein